jgi:hypothetical protein
MSTELSGFGEFEGNNIKALPSEKLAPGIEVPVGS